MISSANKITYFRHHEINKSKWNKCIEEAGNGLIYALSFYLDVMAEGWDALVLNDYEAVMPLTWKRKVGFYYLYQPYFIPSLGVFGLKHTCVSTLDFLMAIPPAFKYWDIKLNETNLLTEIMNNVTLNIKDGINYFLDLNQSYENIYAGYKRLSTRMIKKAATNNVHVITGGKPADVIDFYKKLYQTKHSGISAEVYTRLVIATTKAFEQGQVTVYLARLPDGETTAAYLVMCDQKFVYSLIGGSSEKGKETGSFYLLTDAAIKEHANSNRIFRFEGSCIPGIAFFNEQFGATPVKYLNLVNNKLPFPVNMFKNG